MNNMEQKEYPSDTEEIKNLLEYQQQLQTWMSTVQTKIFDLETSYLEETPAGNIVRGWELDGRVMKSRNPIEDKERLFSFSSYSFLQERKNQSDLNNSNDKMNSKNNQSQLKNKKQKKRKSDFEDWMGIEDY